MNYMVFRNKINRSIKVNKNQCMDPMTGEVNRKELAEIVCSELDLFENDFEIPEFVMELVQQSN